MRQSRYTVVSDGEAGEHLLYNTAFGAFALLDDDAYAQYEACEGPLARQMLEDGFLTELTADEELSAQEANFRAACCDENDFYLIVAPTYACNLRCPYCYEQGHNDIKGKMSGEVVEATMRFIQARYDEKPFKRVNVQWYGGDPSLALDVVEDLSNRLISWCDERGLEYGAMMLTNCNLIDESSVEMLVRARVEAVYMTIDGFEETHNARRVSAVGLNSYERNIEAAKLFVKHGIKAMATMNVDRVNWPEFHPLRDRLRDEVGIDLSPGRLCDYGHFFGTRNFKKPEFDLFEHDEFSRMTHDEFALGGYSADDIREMLRPVPRFCNGQRHNYYIVDTLGDVYICDGHIGESDCVIFNLKDDPSPDQLRMVSHDPYESEQCRACHLVPICQGNCDWERRASDMACHPLLTTLPDYLRDWRNCFEVEAKGYARLDTKRGE